eukprot:CFRG6553T1
MLSSSPLSNTKSNSIMNYSDKMRFINSRVTDAHMKAALPAILASIPEEWRGTTFKNSNLLGRGNFAAKLTELILSKHSNINSQDLIRLGNAEDYLRVSSNVSTVLETALAIEKGYDISQVYTFASKTMPIVVVLLSSSRPVHLHVEVGEQIPFSQDEMDMLKLVGCDLKIINMLPSSADSNAVVLTTSSVNEQTEYVVDGYIQPNVLYITNDSKIVSDDILVIRKRMATPLTTPAALALLESHAGVTVTSDLDSPSEKDLTDLYAHLQVLSGTPVNPDANPVCFTAGLPSICSLWFTLIAQGGADVVMASTAYGGSSQLTDLLTHRSSTFKKHTFDITGTNDISESIQSTLNALATDVSNLLPTTVLFVEIPTNPDMKVPDMGALASMLTSYKSNTSRDVLLLVDTTFAPGSKVMQKINEVAPDLTAMAFISMSKSISRGTTTAGAVVAGSAVAASELLHKIRDTARMLDTTAKRDQLNFLVNNHVGVEERCQSAYEVAVTVGRVLRDAVSVNCNGYDMTLNFVTPKQADMGFTSSTFSFNLPPLDDVPERINEGLAQRFTDLLTSNDTFKPCVSFGQDNGIVYATVPATSTQGAIKEEDKAKQAVGGVQLCRLSFPPSCNVEAVCDFVVAAVVKCYTR